MARNKRNNVVKNVNDVPNLSEPLAVLNDSRPIDLPDADSVSQRAPRPLKSRRVLPDGDFAVLMVMPDQSLAPIHGTEGKTFPTQEMAKEWIRNNGNKLIDVGSHLRLCLVRFISIMTVQFEMKSVVSMVERPKHEVNRETGEREEVANGG